VREGIKSDFEATAGMNWISDLLHYLDWTAHHSDTRTAKAKVFQPYDYSVQEFRKYPVILPVALVLDSRGMNFYVRDTRVSYKTFWKLITA